jgi:hypothetical protein
LAQFGAQGLALVGLEWGGGLHGQFALSLDRSAGFE